MRSAFLRQLLVVAGLHIICAALTACDSPSEGEIRAEFAAFVASRDDCTADNDCALAHTACPLGCYHAVNAQHVEAVESKARELIDEYESGGSACAYGCVQVYGAQCREGACAVRSEPDDAGVPE